MLRVKVYASEVEEVFPLAGTSNNLLRICGSAA